MIIDVIHSGWFADTGRFIEVAYQEDFPVYTKGADGVPVPLDTGGKRDCVTRQTALMVELTSFVDIATLAKHFDVMVVERERLGTVIYLDAKGGCFKQR